MKEWGIKTRVTLLTLVPALTISILLGSYFISIRLQSLSEELQTKGTTALKQIIPQLIIQINRPFHPSLQHFIANTVKQLDILSANIYDAKGTLIAEAGDPILLQNPGSLFSSDTAPEKKIHIIYEKDAVIFLTPIGNEKTAFSSSTHSKPSGWVAVKLSRIPTILQQYQTLFVTLFIIFIGLTISALFGLRLGKDVTDPILLLVNAVEKLKEGQLHTRVHTSAGGELRTLESGINRMAASLNRSHDELQQSIEQATMDLRETLETIEIQNIELDIARKQALEASRVKSEFVANISHELRTPLNGITGFTNLLTKTKLSNRQRDYVSTMQRSTGRLLRIINDILDFSKIEAGKMALEPQVMDLRECIEEAITFLAPSAHDKEIELAFIMYNDTPSHIMCDPLRLNQIITNLVGNAIKFTHHGSVIIRAMLEDEYGHNMVTIRVEVEDTGIGLSDQQKESLFQAFTQADTTTTRKYGGTGLGLAISKKLVEQMGGQIWFDSTLNQGSKFSFTIQCEKSPRTLDTAANTFTNLHALFYEQHDATRISIRHLLQYWGFTVQETNDIDELINLIHQQAGHPFDVILTGVSNEKEQEALQRLAIPHISKITHSPIVLLANVSEETLYNSNRPQGVVRRISKPIRHRRFYKHLVDLLITNIDEDSTVANKINTPPSKTLYNHIHILAVDDNEANLKLIQVLLEEIGVCVHLATTGQTAVALAKEQTFSMILMDIQMPEMDGVEASKRIRAHEEETNDHRTPIIALTADVSPGQREALISAGLDDYQTKPISEEQLRHLINRWTSLKLATKPSNPLEEEIPQHSPLLPINKEQGLKLSNNNESLYIELLSMLLQKLPQEKENISSLLENEQWDALKKVVHKLHGGCSYCGVPLLKSMCLQLEKTLQEAPQQTDLVRQYTHTLLKAIDDTLKAGKHALQEK